MALKGDRREIETDVSFFCNDVCDRGVVLVYGVGGGSGTGGTTTAAGSGASLDQAAAAVSIAGNPSGLVAAGLLLNTFVSIDQTRQHINWHKDEMIVGGKACLLRRGWAVTDQVVGTPAGGNKCYLTTSGKMTPTKSATGGIVATPLVGEFQSGLDQDNFARVAINLPSAQA